MALIIVGIWLTKVGMAWISPFASAPISSSPFVTNFGRLLARAPKSFPIMFPMAEIIDGRAFKSPVTRLAISSAPFAKISGFTDFSDQVSDKSGYPVNNNRDLFCNSVSDVNDNFSSFFQYLRDVICQC